MPTTVEALPATVALKDVYRGDTTEIGTFNLNDSNTDFQTVGVTEVRMQWRDTPANDPVLDKVVAHSTPSANTLSISISLLPEDTEEIPGNTYRYDLEVTLADGRVITPFAGTVTLISDITRTT